MNKVLTQTQLKEGRTRTKRMIGFLELFARCKLIPLCSYAFEVICVILETARHANMMNPLVDRMVRATNQCLV